MTDAEPESRGPELSSNRLGMICNPREVRKRVVTWLAIVACTVILFVWLFCCGPTGLARIVGLQRTRNLLQGEITEMKVKAAVQRADIKDYQKPERIKRIAEKNCNMVPKPESDTLVTKP